MSNIVDESKSIACGWCGAKVGHTCITKTGGRARYPHTARTWPLQNAWVDGYEAGQADVAGQYRSIGTSPWDTVERFERAVDRAIKAVQS